METIEKNTKIRNFTYNFTTSKPSQEVFELLLDVKKWWSGFYEETITGQSAKINDEFSFLAGGGVHFTRQRLIELVPPNKIVWLVFESKLTFLNVPDEWFNTKIRFDIQSQDEKTSVDFTHEGLVPVIECYNECSMAWTGYMKQLEQMLN